MKCNVLQSDENGENLLLIVKDNSEVTLSQDEALELAVYLIDEFPGLVDELEDYLIYVSS